MRESDKTMKDARYIQQRAKCQSSVVRTPPPWGFGHLAALSAASVLPPRVCNSLTN